MGAELEAHFCAGPYGVEHVGCEDLLGKTYQLRLRALIAGGYAHGLVPTEFVLGGERGLVEGVEDVEFYFCAGDLSGGAFALVDGDVGVEVGGVELEDSLGLVVKRCAKGRAARWGTHGHFGD